MGGSPALNEKLPTGLPTSLADSDFMIEELDREEATGSWSGFPSFGLGGGGGGCAER